jgi:hypothetical protein
VSSPPELKSYSRAQYPAVVIEVSYSQKRDLPRLADDYILGSDSDIRVVIGLEVDYKGKMATISVWRPRIQTSDTGEELVAEQTVKIRYAWCMISTPDMPISIRYSVTKTMNRISTYTQAYIFSMKTLPLEPGRDLRGFA